MTMRGITLFETLLYIALFSLLMGGAMEAAYHLSRSAGGTDAALVPEEEGDFVVRKMDAVFANMSAVSVPNTHEVVVTNYDGDRTDIQLAGGAILMQENNAPLMALTTENVRASDLVFTYLPSHGSAPAGIAGTTTINGIDFAITRYVHK